MIKNLLITACVAGAMTVAATAQQAPTQAKVAKMKMEAPAKSAIKVKKFDGRVLESKQLSKDVTLQKVQTANGLTVKRIVDKRRVNKTIKAADVKKATVKSEGTNDAITLNEGFEGWDGVTEGWLPEGWTMESKGEPFESDFITTWFINSNDYGFYPAFDGNYAAEINYDENYKDEWLITPVVDLPEYPNLLYKTFVYPIFLFDLNYIDWETGEFTEKHMAANLQVLVRAEGEEEWNVVKDYFEEYSDWTGSELLSYYPQSFENELIDLSEYKGKRIQVAFRYYGVDGNSMAVESVRVSNPALEASYSWPLGTLFFGVNKDFQSLQLSLPVEPVNTPITWYNTTENYTADFTWEYDDPITAERMSVNSYDLTLTYVPDYSSDFSCRNNMFFTPKLIASAEGAAPGEAQSYDYCQFGGKAEWVQSSTSYNFGLSSFDYQTEGFDIAVLDNDMDAGIPIYGYSKDVDQFWTDYTFQGQEEEGEGVKLTGIFNYYFTQEAPIVISGAWIHGKGQIGADAEFTLEIIPLTDEGEMTAPIATAKCKGSDMIMIEGGMRNYYTVPFTFAEPVVLSQMDCFSYIVRLSGFNDPENVTWFAPYQSAFDNPDGYALGWIEKVITMGGETRSSLSPLAYYTGFQSFGIMLDAAYPWLDADTNEVTISTEGVAEVALGSYYDGSEFTATLTDGSELPAWLTVTTEGRYGNAKVTFTATGNEAASCNVKISAPGVHKVFYVSYDGTTGVEGVNAADGSAVKEVYNAMGQRVAADSDAKGIYLLRRSNGRVEKIIR